MKLLEDYQAALEAIYEHVGFKEDWVVCPIDSQIDKYWDEDGDVVRFADSIEEFESKSGQYYESDIYKQRFHKEWVYVGKDFTLILTDPHTDGMKWASIFDNTKRLKN